MPQIRYPNCGLTINLKNRKETDVSLITKAIEQKTKTFTDLLRVTSLPRKTLSLRLRELCGNGTIVKENGVYRLNEHFETKGTRGLLGSRFSNVLRDKRMRAGIMMIALIVSVPTFSYALATFFLPPQPHERVLFERVLLGSFSMALDVHQVEGLRAWEAVIFYDPGKLKVLDAEPGSFLGVAFPFFVNVTDLSSNVLLLASSLTGDMPSKSGNGTLATITFEYFNSSYEPPHLVPQWRGQETSWINSEDTQVPFDIGTALTLEVVKTK